MSVIEEPRARDERRELARLVFAELGAATGGIGQIHRAIADRAFRAIGPQGRVAELMHHAIAGGVYAGLRGAALAFGRVAEIAVDRGGAADAPPISATPRGALALGALTGLVGDTLERQGSALAQPMSVRLRGRPVALTADGLARAFPDAAPRLAVFVHGLMETERAWWLRTRDGGGTYGARLANDLGLTPVYVRFNSGRHISENGRELSRLLDDLVAAWPVAVGEIALVGHSMGGLVARSACHYGAQDDAPWTKRVRHVVSLGTPHFGAPLAQAVHVAGAALAAVPETRPFGAFLRRRSGGIRDLRHGSLVDEDWQGSDPDALRAAACREVPLLPGATHCFVTATLTPNPDHPLARLVGDTLVLVPSASGRSGARRVGFRDEDGLHVGATHHVALLNHPIVYERLRDWLATSPRELARG